MAQISIFRTSFIWVETVPAVLAGTVPTGSSGSFLGRYGDYVAAFNACQTGTPAAGGLMPPWDRPQGNFFWKYYFEGKQAGEVTGVQAWKKIVPFRSDIACTMVTTNPEVKVALQAFFAPQGIAVVARLNHRGQPKSALDVAKLALAMRHDYRFAVDGSGAPTSGVKLDQAAEQALALTRKRMFGNAEGFPGGNQPFSVTTFLAGENVSAITQGSDEHYLLEAVTGWDQFLKQPELVKLPLAGAQLPVRGADSENMMYARKTGRAVWFPRVFADSSKTPMLSCYHHNLMLASLQTLNLGEFVSWVAAQYDSGAPVAPSVVERAVRAAQLLQMLSAGQSATGRKITYRTTSVVNQIKDAGWDKAIAFVAALSP